MNPLGYVEMAAVEERHWWFAARRAILADVIRRLRPPEGARVLEAGCGTGGNLSMLSGFGRLWAFELNEYARETAREKAGGLGVRLDAGRLPGDIPFDGERFDLICLFDVLEHVEDDAGALAALSGRLAPGGRILLTVPAGPWLYGAHDRFLGHHRRYSASTLGAAAKRAGLRRTRISHFNTLLFAPAAAVRVWEKTLGRGKKYEEANRIPPAPLNALLRTMFAAERVPLRFLDFPFGLSLFAVLEQAKATVAAS